MPMVSKKPRARDNVGDLTCVSRMVYVAPRDFAELKAELVAHFEKLVSVGMHYEKNGSDPYALLCLLQASEVGRMIGRKLGRSESAAFRRASKKCFPPADVAEAKAKRKGGRTC